MKTIFKICLFMVLLNAQMILGSDETKEKLETLKIELKNLKKLLMKNLTERLNEVNLQIEEHEQLNDNLKTQERTINKIKNFFQENVPEIQKLIADLETEKNELTENRDNSKKQFEELKKEMKDKKENFKNLLQQKDEKIKKQKELYEKLKSKPGIQDELKEQLEQDLIPLRENEKIRQEKEEQRRKEEENQREILWKEKKEIKEQRRKEEERKRKILQELKSLKKRMNTKLRNENILHNSKISQKKYFEDPVKNFMGDLKYNYVNKKDGTNYNGQLYEEILKVTTENDPKKEYMLLNLLQDMSEVTNQEKRQEILRKAKENAPEYADFWKSVQEVLDGDYTEEKKIN